MSSFGTVPLNDIWAMLDHCAPGHTRKQRQHNWAITWKGKTYPRLPLGPHGKRQNPGIQVGHVKNMARFFGILECAKGQLPQLK